MIADGVSKEHLLWAVKTIENTPVNYYVFIAAYREWKRFVVSYYKKIGKGIPQIDNLSYNDMCAITDKCKEYWHKPNVIYDKNGITVCEFRQFQDAKMLPIETTWCVTKTKERYEEFCGYDKKCLYIINTNLQSPYNRVLAVIIGGVVEYWDAKNERMSEENGRKDDEVKRFNFYQHSLPQEVIELIYGFAVEQSEKIKKGSYKGGTNTSVSINESKTHKYMTKRISESQLKRIIAESIQNVLNEDYDSSMEELEEGWLGDKLNQGKAAMTTLFQKNRGDDKMSLGDRFSAAKKNWSTQGELNDMSSLRNTLMQLIDARQISPQTTVAQLVGGKINNNRFGNLSGIEANRRGQIRRRGGSAYEE